MAKIFNLPKHKSFNYKPRFYNEKEELRRERNARLQREIEDEKAGRSGRNGEYGNHYIKFARKTRKKSNIRIVVILGVLLLLYYLLMMR